MRIKFINNKCDILIIMETRLDINDEKNKSIMLQYYFEGKTMEDIAKHFWVNPRVMRDKVLENIDLFIEELIPDKNIVENIYSPDIMLNSPVDMGNQKANERIKNFKMRAYSKINLMHYELLDKNLIHPEVIRYDEINVTNYLKTIKLFFEDEFYSYLGIIKIDLYPKGWR